jgi:hypothetical protein
LVILFRNFNIPVIFQEIIKSVIGHERVGIAKYAGTSQWGKRRPGSLPCSILGNEKLIKHCMLISPATTLKYFYIYYETSHNCKMEIRSLKAPPENFAIIYKKILIVFCKANHQKKFSTIQIISHFLIYFKIWVSMGSNLLLILWVSIYLLNLIRSIRKKALVCH